LKIFQNFKILHCIFKLFHGGSTCPQLKLQIPTYNVSVFGKTLQFVPKNVNVKLIGFLISTHFRCVLFLPMYLHTSMLLYAVIPFEIVKRSHFHFCYVLNMCLNTVFHCCTFPFWHQRIKVLQFIYTFHHLIHMSCIQ
jgi:hypothetical protein